MLQHATREWLSLGHTQWGFSCWFLFFVFFLVLFNFFLVNYFLCLCFYFVFVFFVFLVHYYFQFYYLFVQGVPNCYLHFQMIITQERKKTRTTWNNTHIHTQKSKTYAILHDINFI